MADLEKAIKGLEHCAFGVSDACYENDCPYYQNHECTDELKNDILALLKEPKHGHWIDLQKCSNAGVYCSECHVKVFPYYPMKKKLSLFCPHCGAKMDGETVEFNG